TARRAAEHEDQRREDRHDAHPGHGSLRVPTIGCTGGAMSEPVLVSERLVESALAATGLDDFGEPTWQSGLELSVDSLNKDARLHELGEQVVAGEIVDYLSTRLGLLEWRKQHPEVGDADVVPPIVIVGQARTGTTILHDLLAQDPANRVPL